MGSYSKLIASVVGGIVGLILAYLATKGFATCVPVPDGTQACTLFGVSSDQITGIIVGIIGSVFVVLAPKNTPS